MLKLIQRLALDVLDSVEKIVWEMATSSAELGIRADHALNTVRAVFATVPHHQIPRRVEERLCRMERFYESPVVELGPDLPSEIITEIVSLYADLACTAREWKES